MREKTMLNHSGEREQAAVRLLAGGEARGVMLAALLMMLVGWGGLLALVNGTRPRIGGELWAFFILLQVAVTGSAIPFMQLIGQAMSRRRAPLTSVVVRRGVWVGMLAVIYAWLLIPRYLTPAIALMLALLFVVFEIFLRARELANER